MKSTTMPPRDNVWQTMYIRYNWGLFQLCIVQWSLFERRCTRICGKREGPPISVTDSIQSQIFSSPLRKTACSRPAACREALRFSLSPQSHFYTRSTYVNLACRCFPGFSEPVKGCLDLSSEASVWPYSLLCNKWSCSCETTNILDKKYWNNVWKPEMHFPWRPKSIATRHLRFFCCCFFFVHACTFTDSVFHWMQSSIASWSSVYSLWGLT